MQLILTLVSHLLPVMITGGAVVTALALWIGGPYCRHVFFISNAANTRGVEDLARHLARQVGGKRLGIEQAWEMFIPAARKLSQDYIEKRQAVARRR